MSVALHKWCHKNTA